jgi:hypothetical protein
MCNDPQTDDVRPEYEEGFFRHGVRGKYAERYASGMIEPPPMSADERERRRRAPRDSTNDLIEHLPRRLDPPVDETTNHTNHTKE